MGLDLIDNVGLYYYKCINCFKIPTKIFFIFKLDLKIPKMVEYVMCPVPKKPKFINYAE